MKKTKHTDYEDDGRTIANMNVDGMPWYVRGDEKRAKKDRDSVGSPLTDEELRLYKFAALKSALLVVLVFAAVFFLFIAFCDFVWFK
ncbi:MAG: hypothetical protein IKG70_07225 [Lachnospiraceae bacterium]|nr:hypothetical protein [Lachnospiraceae bacterium]